MLNRQPDSVILRDPQAAQRALWSVVALIVLWPMFALSEFKPAQLFDSRNLDVIGRFLRGFLPPALSADFLGQVARATLETLAMATAGIALAMVIAVPLALLLAHSLSISRIGPGPGWLGGETLRALVRGLLMVLRGIPELVWALLFVRALGLGPGAGVLALAITYGGMLGKVYAEILESNDTRPVRALLESGAGSLSAFFYGLLPVTAQELASYTVYRWECAVRASVIMGFVGAGGLGQLVDQSLRMMNGGEVATILITFLVLVMLADGLSGWLRKLLA